MFQDSMYTNSLRGVQSSIWSKVRIPSPRVDAAWSASCCVVYSLNPQGQRRQRALSSASILPLSLKKHPRSDLLTLAFTRVTPECVDRTLSSSKPFRPSYQSMTERIDEAEVIRRRYIPIHQMWKKCKYWLVCEGIKRRPSVYFPV